MRWLCFLFTLVFLGQAQAAYYLDHLDGVPYTWQTFPIQWKYDEGLNLTLVDEAFATWMMSGVSFENSTTADDLGLDINADNIEDYIAVDSEGFLRNANEETLVINDADAGILNLLSGGFGAFILGVATPGVLNDSDMSITGGLLILRNVGDTDGLRFTAEHESGHLLNLSHTQVNQDEGTNLDGSDDGVVPMMFPFALDPNFQAGLLADDIFSFQTLYDPTSLAAKGSISGHVTNRSGEGVLGVDVTCRPTAGSKANAVSALSGIDLQGTGAYTCGNLDNGNYTVDIKPITLAIAAFDPDPPFAFPEFYNGPNEDFDATIDDAEESTSVAVADSADTPDIDLVLNVEPLIQSGVEYTGEIGAFGYSDSEYILRVPKGATSVIFDLDSVNDGVDLDILGRCGQPFSVNPILNVPWFDLSGGEQQADFNTPSVSGDERVKLDTNSDPPLEACDYHILIINNSSTASTTYTFTGTIFGASPRLIFRPGGLNLSDPTSGQVATGNWEVQVQDDEVRVQELIFKDKGIGDFTRVMGAALVRDTNEDGDITVFDTVISNKATVDVSSRSLTFQEIAYYMDEDSDETWVLVYDLAPESASFPVWSIFLLLPLLLVRSKKSSAVLIALIAFSLSTCGEGGTKEYDPTVDDNDVKVRGTAFGASVEILDDNVTSVKDFFD